VVPGTQDAIQIVSQAALCFDNRQVTILWPAFYGKFITSTALRGYHINKVSSDYNIPIPNDCRSAPIMLITNIILCTR
jgi:hypothetical protein